MNRSLFNLLVALSLLLLAVVISDRLFHHPSFPPIPPPTVVITSAGGAVTYNYNVSAISTVHYFHIFGVRILSSRAMLLAAVIPTCWVLQRLLEMLRKKPARGLCPHCGYDLRATPDRCPECGAASQRRF